MRFSPSWDLSTIPLDKLKSEWARRCAAKASHPIKHDPTTEAERKRQREYRRERRKRGLDK
jgi:hypothetical protein